MDGDKIEKTSNRVRMKIVILTSLFHPEIAANAKRMTHLGQVLKEEGHDVYVITAFPYYSTSRDLGRYKGRYIVKDQYQGISVIRTHAYYPGKYGNLFKRFFSFLSFLVCNIQDVHEYYTSEMT